MFENKIGVLVPNVMLPPKGADFEKWAVVACDQVELGAGTSVQTPEEAVAWFDALPAKLQEASKKASDYCRSNAGATDAIMKIIFA